MTDSPQRSGTPDRKRTDMFGGLPRGPIGAIVACTGRPTRPGELPVDNDGVRGVGRVMRFLGRSARGGGLVVLAALALTLSACSSTAGPAPSAAGGPGSSQGAAVTALAFTGTTLDGTTFDAATLSGTPVVLWFWAPWCTICRAEAPDVAAIAAEYEGRVRVLGVPGRGQVDAMKTFVADAGVGAITHVVDADGTLWNRFGVVSQPSFVFVDRAGGAESFAGSLGADGLRAAVDELA